jgi:PhoH-like ATPase
VLDTSVYLTDSQSIYNFKNNDIVVPLKVLDEIDKHKKRQDSVGVQARNIIRIFDQLRDRGNLFKGVRLRKGQGILIVRKYNPFCLPDDLELEDSDNQIIATALTSKSENPKRKVVLVSRDINMRVKCDALGIDTMDYDLEQVVDDPEGLYSGTQTLSVPDSFVEGFYSDSVFLDEKHGKFYPNQFIMLSSKENEKKTALAKFKGYGLPLRRVSTLKSTIWGVRGRNKEQTYALDLLMDPSIPVVTLVGQAGSGKTLLALCAALEQTFGSEPQYKKIVVTKPVQPVGKDIGFLPGTMEEKMLPWLAPIQDNLQYLFGNDKMTLDMYANEGKIEVEAMTFIRGRSIANAFIIVDEVQNMTQHEIKTVLTRVGEGTKVVLTGDIDQIDNVYIDATNNGLTYVVERFKDQDISGHMTLTKGERSDVATIAAKIL